MKSRQAIQKSSMTGQQTPIPGLDATLEKRFHQIAQCSGNNDGPAMTIQSVRLKIGKIAADDPGNRVGRAPNRRSSLPMFSWAIRVRRVCVAEKPTGKVAAGVAGHRMKRKPRMFPNGTAWINSWKPNR